MSVVSRGTQAVSCSCACAASPRAALRPPVHAITASGQQRALCRPAPLRRQPLRCRASIVSRTTLPPEFSEEKGYKLQFVVFSRLAPEQTTGHLREHLPEHEAWLKGLGASLAFHGPFLNAEASYYGSEMFAVVAESAAEARQLVEQDPLHSKGIRRFELMSWVQQTQW